MSHSNKMSLCSNTGERYLAEFGHVAFIILAFVQAVSRYTAHVG